MTNQQRLAPIEPAAREQISRRTLLKAGAAGALTAIAGAGARAAESESIAAIDAHTHFYDPTRPQGVPWPDKRNKLLYRPVLPDEFKQLTRPQHIGGTVVVEASPWVEDNQWLLDLAEREPFLVGVVGRLDPADEQFPSLLRRFAPQRRFRGIRISHDTLNKALEQPRK